jgi:hypothetical protein
MVSITGDLVFPMADSVDFEVDLELIVLAWFLPGSTD